MAVIKVVDFGGEVPRVSPRALPAGAAQTYRNLLATSAELRPLAGDKDVGAAPAGAKTLYRLSRNADGSLRTGDSAGWIAELQDKNYVKGQLNDDATERTVVTWNDGTSAARVIDAKGADRLLGVPSPPKLALTHVVVDEFTADEALTWVDEEMVPALADAVSTSLIEGRLDGANTMAGVSSLTGWEVHREHEWMRVHSMDYVLAQGVGVTGPELGGYLDIASYKLPLQILPYWGKLDRIALEGKIRLIENPKDGTQLWTDTQIATLADKLVALFDPDGDSIKPLRDRLDKAAADFKSALSFQAVDPGPRPVEPVKPNVPEHLVMDGG